MSLLGGQSWDLLEDAGLWKCDKKRRNNSRGGDRAQLFPQHHRHNRERLTRCDTTESSGGRDVQWDRWRKM